MKESSRERVYDAVVLVSGCTARDIADALVLPFEEVSRELKSLAGAEMIREVEGRWFHGKKLKDESPVAVELKRASRYAGGRVIRKGHGAA